MPVHRNSSVAMMTVGRHIQYPANARQQKLRRQCGTGLRWHEQTLRQWAIFDRWRARQGFAAGAGLVAPAIRARPTLADSAFAVALKTQRRHALADRLEIVGGAGCMRRHVVPVIDAPVMPEDGCSIVNDGFCSDREAAFALGVKQRCCYELADGFSPPERRTGRSSVYRRRDWPDIATSHKVR